MSIRFLNFKTSQRLQFIPWFMAFALLPMTDVLAQHLDVVGSARVSEMDTLNMLQANIVSMADGTLALRQFEVGDYAHGGIVFWVDESGEHGLVCDTADIHDGIAWRNGTDRVTNATGDGVGAGEMNTVLAIAMQTNDNTTGEFAALLCAELMRAGYGDWYLPSKEELNLMYDQRAIINTSSTANGGSAFVGADYWSSTELTTSGASEQNFGNGTQNNQSKQGLNRVRAIRAF
ncbi:MAG: DUF1566 domain-containing protein [Saprospiraceae bacterium]|nr:DUF1566 domain-containing protein [Saprospiraceae bacterium]